MHAGIFTRLSTFFIFVTTMTLMSAVVVAQEKSAWDPAAWDPDSVTVLPDDQQAVLKGIHEDPAPKSLIYNAHYVISDETRHDVFYNKIKDLGGMYVGVGTDQSYLYIGWSRPQVAVIMDFDKLIIDLHEVYRLIFLKAETPDEFVKLWYKENKKKIIAMIKEAFPEPVKQKRIIKAFKFSRSWVAGKMGILKKHHKKHKVPIWITDAGQYKYIRDMFKAGRIVMLRGDLTATKAMPGIAEASKKLGIPVRVFYLSNCEQYFFYEEQYRANIQALPTDAKTLFLRAFAWASNPDYGLADTRYHYNWQSAENFKDWMANSKANKVGKMLIWRTKGKVTGTSEMKITPAEVNQIMKKKRKKKKKKGKKH